MEIKSNQATGNRPEGDRILDAPYVFTDIPMYLEQLKSEKSWSKNDRNAITVYKSEKVTILVAVLKSRILRDRLWRLGRWCSTPDGRRAHRPHLRPAHEDDQGEDDDRLKAETCAVHGFRNTAGRLRPAKS